tara:strand:+ start:338 stop:484 length:147 start_codon:yes stop_codon:yes gene_type:complete
MVNQIAKNFTAAWNSRSPQAVATFYADVLDLTLACDAAPTQCRGGLEG